MGKTTFVVHRFQGRKDNYYLRLAHEGVLMNWAIPEGIPDRPGQQLPAQRLRDGSPQSASFEGKISSREFGEGLLSIWDRGDCDLEKCKEVRIQFSLRGSRAAGRYSLVRANGKERPNWLLTRLDDAEAVSAFPAPEPVAAAPENNDRENPPRRRPRSRRPRASAAPPVSARPRRSRVPAAASPPPPAPPGDRPSRESDDFKWRIGGFVTSIPLRIISPFINIYYDISNEKARRRSLRERRGDGPKAPGAGEASDASAGDAAD